MVSILEYVGKNDKQLEFEESYDTITAYLMESVQNTMLYRRPKRGNTNRVMPMLSFKVVQI